MRSTFRHQPGWARRMVSVHRVRRLVVAASRDRALIVSPQAIRLHALGLVMTGVAGWGGLVGRAEAERLADRCGALVDELVDAGFWLEGETGYRIRAGALVSALEACGPPPGPRARRGLANRRRRAAHAMHAARRTRASIGSRRSRMTAR